MLKTSTVEFRLISTTYISDAWFPWRKFGPWGGAGWWRWGGGADWWWGGWSHRRGRSCGGEALIKPTVQHFISPKLHTSGFLRHGANERITFWCSLVPKKKRQGKSETIARPTSWSDCKIHFAVFLFHPDFASLSCCSTPSEWERIHSSYFACSTFQWALAKTLSVSLQTCSRKKQVSFVAKSKTLAEIKAMERQPPHG